MKTVIAAFRDREHANEAAARLNATNFESKSMRVIEHSSGGTQIIETLRTRGVPEDRATLYRDALQQGAALAVVDAKDNEAKDVALFLDECGSLDLESGRGWAQEDLVHSESMASEDIGTRPLEGSENLAVVEEQVRIGKMEIEKGGKRIRTFVTETPVQQQVQLREEHIEVTREPVNEPTPIANTDTTFTEDEYVVTATGEEAVVEKQARVVERVRVEKQAEQHTETIEDVERRRDVAVEDLPPQQPRR